MKWFFYFILAPRMLLLRPLEAFKDLKNVWKRGLQEDFTREYIHLREDHVMPFWYCVYTALGKYDLLQISPRGLRPPFFFTPFIHVPLLSSRAKRVCNGARTPHAGKMFHLFHVKTTLWNKVVEHTFPSNGAGSRALSSRMFQCSIKNRLCYKTEVDRGPCTFIFC